MDCTAETRDGWSVAGLGPGPGLVERLGRVPVVDVPDDELIERLIAWGRVRNRADAGMAEQMGELVRRWAQEPLFARDRNGRAAQDGRNGQVGRAGQGGWGGGGLGVEEFVSDGIALALTLSPRTAKAKVVGAVQLGQRLPQVLDAVASGAVEYCKAEAINAETAFLQEADAVWVAG